MGWTDSEAVGAGDCWLPSAAATPPVRKKAAQKMRASTRAMTTTMPILAGTFTLSFHLLRLRNTKRAAERTAVSSTTRSTSQ